MTSAATHDSVPVAVIDCGLGNLGSLLKMLERVGATPRVVSDPASLASTERILLPGVGAFDTGVEHLRASGMLAALDAARGRAACRILGVCLGMQLLFDRSEEGSGTAPGLGWIPGEIRRLELPSGSDLKIPHMGWNDVELQRADPLYSGLEEGARFYYVHSYHAVPADPGTILTRTEYGMDFVSSVRSGNVWGVQFHPEKSHRYGQRLLENFVHA